MRRIEARCARGARTTRASEVTFDGRIEVSKRYRGAQPRQARCTSRPWRHVMLLAWILILTAALTVVIGVVSTRHT